MRRRQRRQGVEAELDITAFMNLMIVLVPVLLLGMVFSRITAIDVTLPPDAASSGETDDNRRLELVIRADGMRVNYPPGVLLKPIPLTADGDYDFALLGLVLQEVRRQLRERGVEKDDITLLVEPDISYQSIVTTMDTVRSFKALVAASVVDAALFPAIAFGDAPAI